MTQADLERAVERKAQEMFRARWPGKAWDGCDVSRSYWRRKARAEIARLRASPDNGGER